MHLLSALSPEWTKPGEVIELKNAPTYFGPVSLSVTSSDRGAKILFIPSFRKNPEAVLIHVPFYATATEAKVNGRTAAINNGVIALGPETSEVEILWTRDPAKEMSYQKAVADYKAEYQKRWEAQKK